jgi:phosphatidylglycerophosphatase A
MGALAALPLAWLIYQIGGIWLFVLIPATYIKGYIATKWMTGSDDHPES